MGLKDKTSLYDLVPGPDAPIGDFEDIQGSGGNDFDLGQSSTLQQDSLLNQYLYTHGGVGGIAGPVPLPSHYADLDGQPGPTFNLGADSLFHAGGDPVVGASLLSVYNGSSGLSLFSAPQSGNPVSQDLDGGLPSTGKYENNGPDGGFY
jgi:hypothetical protein